MLLCDLREPNGIEVGITGRLPRLHGLHGMFETLVITLAGEIVNQGIGCGRIEPHPLGSVMQQFRMPLAAFQAIKKLVEFDPRAATAQTGPAGHTPA